MSTIDSPRPGAARRRVVDPVVEQPWQWPAPKVSNPEPVTLYVGPPWGPVAAAAGLPSTRPRFVMTVPDMTAVADWPVHPEVVVVDFTGGTAPDWWPVVGWWRIMLPTVPFIAVVHHSPADATVTAAAYALGMDHIINCSTGPLQQTVMAIAEAAREAVSLASDLLTERHQQALYGVQHGRPRAVVADRLSIADETLRSHVNGTHQRLGVQSTPGAASVAWFNGHLGGGPPRQPLAGAPVLTEEEVLCVRWLAAGWSRPAIADQVGESVSHVTRVLNTATHRLGVLPGMPKLTVATTALAWGLVASLPDTPNTGT